MYGKLRRLSGRSAAASTKYFELIQIPSRATRFWLISFLLDLKELGVVDHHQVQRHHFITPVSAPQFPETKARVEMHSKLAGRAERTAVSQP